jgi:hypothetical protein
MTYAEWFDSFAEAHGNIVSKLLEQGYDKARIIDYFDFDNLVEAEPDFCPLYAQKKKCHEMERLNCYLCACPHFRFDDSGMQERDGATLYSSCVIEAKAGAQYRFDNAIHQDCSACTLPHQRRFVEKHFSTDWKQMMRLCPPRRQD